MKIADTDRAGFRRVARAEQPQTGECFQRERSSVPRDLFTVRVIYSRGSLRMIYIYRQNTVATIWNMYSARLFVSFARARVRDPI